MTLLMVFGLHGVFAASATANPANMAADRERQGYPSEARRIVVLGDSLGEGVWSGLYWAFKRERNVEVVKHAKLSTGLVRDDRFNWPNEVRKLVQREKIDVAIFIVGTNDNQSIRRDNKVMRAYTPEWRAEYARRVDEILGVFVDADVPVVWMGLPIMRPDRFREVATEVNDIFRERAELAGVPFVSTWEEFVDRSGGYTPYLQDDSGRARLVRAKDGVHFTARGYRQLASLVEGKIRGSFAQQERAVLDDVAALAGGRGALLRDNARVGAGGNHTANAAGLVFPPSIAAGSITVVGDVSADIAPGYQPALAPAASAWVSQALRRAAAVSRYHADWFRTLPEQRYD